MVIHAYIRSTSVVVVHLPLWDQNFPQGVLGNSALLLCMLFTSCRSPSALHCFVHLTEWYPRLRVSLAGCARLHCQLGPFDSSTRWRIYQRSIHLYHRHRMYYTQISSKFTGMTVIHGYSRRLTPFFVDAVSPSSPPSR